MRIAIAHPRAVRVHREAVRVPHMRAPHISLPSAEGAPEAPRIAAHMHVMTAAQGTPWFARREARSLERGARFADGGDAAIRRATHIAHRQMGGEMMMTAAAGAPWFDREAARGMTSPRGFIHGIGAGRNDKNNLAIGAGSYVLPADVVAGLGEGNSLGGAALWDAILHSMPYGIEEPRLPRARMGPPRPPTDRELAQGLWEGAQHAARGGASVPRHPLVPVVAADGEIVVSPSESRLIGRLVRRAGDASSPPDDAELVRRGHAVLDEFVRVVRGRTIRKQRSLPGPVHSKHPQKGHV